MIQFSALARIPHQITECFAIQTTSFLLNHPLLPLNFTKTTQNCKTLNPTLEECRSISSFQHSIPCFTLQGCMFPGVSSLVKLKLKRGMFLHNLGQFCSVEQCASSLTQRITTEYSTPLCEGVFPLARDKFCRCFSWQQCGQKLQNPNRFSPQSAFSLFAEKLQPQIS